jgi:hypothetical protein
MLEKVLTILIPVITLILSVITSVIVTTLRNKAELAKIQIELEQNYAKSLFDKRIEIYPELYNLLSAYIKLIEYGKQGVENLIEFRDKIDKWNSQYSMFFTLSTSMISASFRRYLRQLLSYDSEVNISAEDWKVIRKIMRSFEMSLRAEIGIFDIKPAGLAKEVDNVKKLIASTSKDPM